MYAALYASEVEATRDRNTLLDNGALTGTTVLALHATTAELPRCGS